MNSEVEQIYRDGMHVGTLSVTALYVTPDPIWMAHEWPMSAGARV
jgi:hypothetical protein